MMEKRVWVGPDPGLFGRMMRHGACQDGGIVVIQLLIAGALQMKMAEGAVVRPAGAASAVFDDEIGVLLPDGVDKVREGLVVADQPFRRGHPAVVAADAGALVIVVFDVAHAHRVKLVDPSREMLPNRFAAEVEEIARNGRSVAPKQAVVAELCGGGIGMDGVQLEPYAGL